MAQTRAGVKAVTDNVAALKGTVESAGKSNGGQFAKVSEAIARLSEGVERAERLQAEPAARLTKVIETLERLSGGRPAWPPSPRPPAPFRRRPLGQAPQSLQQQQQQLQAQPSAPALPPPQIVAEAKPRPLPSSTAGCCTAFRTASP